ncbi:MAG: hypothetical protein KDA37_10055, partial [Planctomycetales bacterium]|nr:hypothetical protein [Planctomycetales bacterium]
MPQIAITPNELIPQPTTTARPSEPTGEFADRLAAAQEADKPRAPRSDPRDSVESTDAAEQEAAVEADVQPDQHSPDDTPDASHQDQEADAAPVAVEIVVSVQQDTVEISEEIAIAQTVLPPDGDRPEQETEAALPDNGDTPEQSQQSEPTDPVLADLILRS